MGAKVATIGMKLEVENLRLHLENEEKLQNETKLKLQNESKVKLQNETKVKLQNETKVKLQKEDKSKLQYEDKTIFQDKQSESTYIILQYILDELKNTKEWLNAQHMYDWIEPIHSIFLYILDEMKSTKEWFNAQQISDWSRSIELWLKDSCFYDSLNGFCILGLLLFVIWFAAFIFWKFKRGNASYDSWNESQEELLSSSSIDYPISQVFNKLKEILSTADTASNDDDSITNHLNDDFLTLVAKRIAGDESMEKGLFSGGLLTAENLMQWRQMYEESLTENLQVYNCARRQVTINIHVLVNGRKVYREENGVINENED
ncbi:uncharacterized protein [Parasteatoda tepidariorum]|uniref:uncharacterized protein n=1 Tax=Parasteatoda tepidariorum TaxID=114398 RepID=UPI001C721049|nr:uncharacterized protein LOC107441405 [Parasteatoda tepidariorum]